MPLRPDLALSTRQLRRVGVGSVVVLGLALVAVERVPFGESVEASAQTLADVLRRATSERVAGIAFRATALPRAEERDWLRALQLAGTDVTWRPLDSLSRAVISIEPTGEPDGSQLITMMGPSGTTVRLEDEGGVLDSMVIGPRGVLVRSAIGSRDVRGTIDAASMRASADSVAHKPVLVVGRASWETKFTVVALQESGWLVDARMTVAPGVTVSLGSPDALDTARYAATVVLDTGLVRSSALEAFAHAGGGVIIGGNANDDARLLALAGVRHAGLQRPEMGALVGAHPTDGLVAQELPPRDSLTVVIARRHDAPIAVARRLGVGRVIAVGFRDTWRWRLEGSEGSANAHRQWWSRVVSQVAYLPVVSPSTTDGLDGAPLAALHAVLGQPREQSGTSTGWWRWLVPLVFTLSLVSLLAEWAVRRIRGER